MLNTGVQEQSMYRSLKILINKKEVEHNKGEYWVSSAEK